ncbi:hypothetical protein BDN72DRAFT_767972 [Pluteus cervinus]|uniref:Uncharacterized protein n=1 Tax=Pluteus cervinus TaxID=181527 RepID=A0ACD3AVK3_9AGAR|nr:hypothetical protein BDN72DRAFT_767972 [Pluteus cervinus]
MSTPIQRDKTIKMYFLYMAIRNFGLLEDSTTDIDEILEQLRFDLAVLRMVQQTRYLNGRHHKHSKGGILDLAWEFVENPKDHPRFTQMLRVSPFMFNTIISLIEDHSVFQNHSNNPQTPVRLQLATVLYRMGRSISLNDLSITTGFSIGSIENFTRRLTPEEKEVEKQWIDQRTGWTGGLWREGWLMYDGTIVVLHEKPVWNGSGYFTRKSNYGLNAQVSSTVGRNQLIAY